MQKKTKKPIAVISGDIHYNLKTLEVADNATRQAITKANELDVPFISNGDLHDSKANLRGECINRIIETFKLCNKKPYVNVGNHSLINEKGKEHALHFLAAYAYIIDEPKYIEELESFIIPYYSDGELLLNYLEYLMPSVSRLIMHQGVNGSNMGHYIQDKSAIPKEALADFRVILSHYHAHQNIECGPIKANNIGLATYIGSPYSTSYGEANDPPKGFGILYSDGSLEFVPTNLRKHIVLEYTYGGLNFLENTSIDIKDNDLLWVKVKGPKEVLDKLTKQSISINLNITIPFKLDLIPNKVEFTAKPTKELTQNEVFDNIIERSNIEVETKKRLQTLWKQYAD